MRKSLFPCIAVLVTSISLVSAAESKSLWQSFVDFFSPTEKSEGDGPLYRQLSDLDREIHKNEQAYSRERRPQKKSYLRSHLEDLRKQRAALVAKIKAEEAKSSSSASAPASSSSAQAVPAVSRISAASATSSSAGGSSSSVVARSPSSTPASEVVTAKQPMLAYVFRDTVFVRDTVVVHDTIFAPSPCASDSLKLKTQMSK